MPAPAVIEPPSHPEVAVWRAISLDDVDALMPARLAMDRADHPEHVTARQEILDELSSSHVDLAVDSMLALGADDRVLAYGLVSLEPGQETRVQSSLLGGVHPDVRGRGIGRQLMSWERERSEQQLAGSDKTLPGWSILSVEEHNTAAISLAEQQGMSVARYFTQMERDLAEPVPEIEPRGDVRIVPFSPGLSEAARLARNDSFRDHWGSQSTNVERWNNFAGGEHFRSDLSWLAVTGRGGEETVVGFALTTVNEDDWQARGQRSAYIALVGVVRSWRGMRIAPAVLATALTSHREAGLAVSILDVDSASPTGANTLYERMGFVPGHREVALVAEY
ncbi:GNAT family N-acetyltransferase [Okibacterium endophyticum]